LFLQCKSPYKHFDQLNALAGKKNINIFSKIKKERLQEKIKRFKLFKEILKMFYLMKKAFYMQPIKLII